MSLLFETLLIKNGRILSLAYHEKRLNIARKKFFGKVKPLRIVFKPPQDNTTYRLRVSYGKEIEKIELFPYKKNYKKRILLVHQDLSYSYKFSNRDSFDSLYEKNCDFDDFLIVKKGLITDTTIANCSFFDGRRWLTPSTPLLKGTTRERLIQGKFLFPTKIYLKDLHQFSHIGLCNALTGFYVAGETKRILHVK